MSMKHDDSYPAVVDHNYKRMAEIMSRSPRTKYVIISVSIVAVTLIVTGGYVGAMFAVQVTADKAISSHHLSLRHGNVVIEETIEEYPDDVIQYSVDSPDGSFIVMDDFSRRLKVLSDRTTCTVTPLNESKHDIDALEDLDDQIPESAPKQVFSIKPMPDTIRDHQILGAHAQTRCYGLPLYWAEIVPLAPNTEMQGSVRQRRRAVAMYCYWDSSCQCRVCYA